MFKGEMGDKPADFSGIEKVEFDATSHHLIAVENFTGEVVGRCRLRTAETNTGDKNFVR